MQFTKECIDESIIKTFIVRDPSALANSTGQFFPECACEIMCPIAGCNGIFKCFYREYVEGGRSDNSVTPMWRKPCWHYQSFTNHYSRRHQVNPPLRQRKKKIKTGVQQIQGMINNNIPIPVNENNIPINENNI